HTRSDRDWSSDVCSSDLAYVRVRWLSVLPQRTLAVGAHLASSASLLALYVLLTLTHDTAVVIVASAMPFAVAGVAVSHYYQVRRSEERRVGKEGRSRWWR